MLIDTMLHINGYCVQDCSLKSFCLFADTKKLMPIIVNTF